jgi:phytoene desaturase
VTLFEKSAWLGGKAAVLSDHGFRFDMGPTILTMPSVLRRIFGESGKHVEDYLDLVRLDPQWRCFYEDGSILDLEEDRERMAGALEQFAPGSSEGYRRFLNFARRMHDISERFFFWKSIGGLSDMIDFSVGFKPKLLADVMAMRMGRSVASTVRKHVPEPRAAQMLDHFTQYVGSCPERSPAVLCGIASMQVAEGIWYPKGGTGAVPAALEKRARELGVIFHLNRGVRSIDADKTGRTATGLTTDDGERFDFDRVVSNSDTVRAHRELLDPESRASRKFEKRRRYEPACSGVVLYLGLDRGYEHLLHHNFVFSRDPHAEFESIYTQGEPAADPTCYVCAPARTEPSVAPPGGEALYVLVHTPYLRPGHDWSTMFPAYRQAILDKLKRCAAMPDLEQRIQFESYLTPQDIHDRYRVLNGAIYGLASHGKWHGAFKPANRCRDMKNLYLAGGSAHPGPGMPMALMSGWIAAHCLDHDAADPAARRPAPMEFSAS